MTRPRPTAASVRRLLLFLACLLLALLFFGILTPDTLWLRTKREEGSGKVRKDGKAYLSYDAIWGKVKNSQK